MSVLVDLEVLVEVLELAFEEVSVELEVLVALDVVVVVLVKVVVDEVVK